MTRKNPAAVALGKRRAKLAGAACLAAIGSIGGKAAAENMTAAQRKKRAKAAVAARERKRRDKR